MEKQYISKDSFIGILVVIAVVFIGAILLLTSLGNQSDGDEGYDLTFTQKIIINNKDISMFPLLRCVPVSKVSCDSNGCSKENPVVWVNVNKISSTYSRCDVKGCDTYDADISDSGMYTNIQPKDPNGSFIKIDNSTGEYIEVVSLGTGTLTSFGVCK